MAKQKFSVVNLVNNDGCFDLQFRKDVRHERTNSPAYYRWKAQFIVTSPKDFIKNLEIIKKEIKCGDIHISNGQARLSVQKISDINGLVVPYFRKNLLAGNKKKVFELWAKGVGTISNNKGKTLSAWKKNELNQLLQIQKSCSKYKKNPRECKWLEMARALTKTV